MTKNTCFVRLDMICSFLSNKDIDSFKCVSICTAMACLSEMKKINVATFFVFIKYG